MNTLRKCLAIAAICTLILGSTKTANAGSVTGTLSINANAVSTCTSVSATAMAFGAYTNNQLTALAGTSTVTLTCGIGAIYALDANSGGHASGGGLRMADTGAANFLPYNLYKDVTHLLLFGTGQTLGTTITGVAAAASSTLTVYGLVPASQSVAVTNYSDSVTLTLSF